MQNIGVISSRLISTEEIVGFVKAARGYWNDDVGLNQGVIEKGSARIFIHGDGNITNACYEPEELARLKMQLGAAPQSYISIHIGHGDESRELAFEVARRMIIVWGGLIDDNMENFVHPEKANKK